MARTRSQATPGAKTETTLSASASSTKKNQASQKRKHDPDEESSKQPAAKKARADNDAKSSDPTTRTSSNDIKSKIQSLISTYGYLPLHDLPVESPTSSTPETILALLFHAMLTSARISHELAYKSVRCLIEARYHYLDTLLKSSWEERTEVLTKGGYTRYREKTATALGELAEKVRDDYDGDLNNILKQSKGAAQVRKSLGEIKGIGNVGLDIFCDTAQHVWPSLAPFVDQRSLKTAEAVGIGSDVTRVWEAVEKDAGQMCKLASALTKVRLEKKEKEFA